MSRIVVPLLLLLSLICTSRDATAQEPRHWRWVVPIGGPRDDAAYDVALDEEGNAYVVGIFRDSIRLDGAFATSGNTTAEAYFYIAKIADDGRASWIRHGGGRRGATGRLVRLDDRGNIYAAGSFEDSARFGDATIRGAAGYRTSFIACYTPEGELRWINTVAGNGIGDGIRAMGADEEGNLYVAGHSIAESFTVDDVTISKPGSFLLTYDVTGRAVRGRALGDCMINDLTILGVDSLYLLGFASQPLTLDDLTLAQSDPSHYFHRFLIRFDKGRAVWGKTTAEGLFNVDIYRQVIQPDGFLLAGSMFSDIVVEGRTLLAPSQKDAFYVADYDHDGTLRWARAFSARNGAATIEDIVRGSDGRTILAGTFHDTIEFDGTMLRSDGGPDIFVAAIDGNGAVDWAERCGDPLFDSPHGIDYRAGAGLRMVGEVQKADLPAGAPDFGALRLDGPGVRGKHDGFIARLDIGVSGIVDERNGRTALRLAPNPAASSLTITYTVDAPSTATVELLDPLGRSVASVAPRRREGGIYSETLDVDALQAGAYLVRVRIDAVDGEEIVRIGRVALVR